LEIYNFITSLDYSSPEGLMLVCKVISIPLTFVIVYFGYKYFKLTSFSTLQSFTIGFSFMAAADLFAFVCILTQFEDKNSILWIQSILMSYGFSFIAATYYYKMKSEKKLFSINKIFSLAIIPLIAYIGIFSVLELSEMSDFFSVEEYFLMFNLFILAYISKHTLVNAVTSARKELVYIPMAFVLLFVGQLTALIYSIDGGYASLVSSIILKNAGLAVFFIVILQITYPKTRLQISR